VITRARCRNGGRTGTSHDVRITGTAHSTHRQEGVPGRYRGLEQRRCLSPDDNTQAVRGHPSRVPAVPIHRVLGHCWLAVLPRRRVASSSPSSRAYHCARMRVEICVLPRTRRRSIGALSRREAASCPRVRPVSSTSGTARPRCSIMPASCGRAQRSRRPHQVAASRGGPVGSGQSAAVRHQQQHEASPQHPAQWNVVHVVGSYGDCRHRHGRSARSPGSPDRRGGEAKRSLLRHRVAGTGVL